MQIVGAELVLARFGDEILVRGTERREIESAGIRNDRNDEKTRAVFAFAIDRQAEMDARLETRSGAPRFVAAERVA